MSDAKSAPKGGRKARTLEEEIAAQLAQDVPIGRFATPEEVAAAVAFLCTPAAASINGINVPVDGGKTGSL